MKETCKSCKWFRLYDGCEEVGNCLRYPPRILDMSYSVVSHLPEVWHDDFCGEFALDTISSENRDNKSIIDLSQLADQASFYLKNDIMWQSDFLNNVLKKCMGLGTNKASRLLRFMKSNGFFITSRKQNGGYWISANDSLIDAKNREIDEARS